MENLVLSLLKLSVQTSVLSTSESGNNLKKVDLNDFVGFLKTSEIGIGFNAETKLKLKKDEVTKTNITDFRRG